MLLLIADKYFDIEPDASLKEHLQKIRQFHNFYCSQDIYGEPFCIYLNYKEVSENTNERLVYSGQVSDTQYKSYVYSGDTFYRIVIANEEHICHSVKLDKDGHCSQIEIPRLSDDLQTHISEAISTCCTYSLTLHQTLMIHASVVQYNGKGYLFLGRSGRGKSTHSRLWTENIQGATLLNDDSPYIHASEEGSVVSGSPWSGKTHCYVNKTIPIGGIVLLHQSCNNKIEKAKKLRAISNIMPCIAGDMKWDANIHNKVLDVVEKIVSTINVYDLWCTPTKDAAMLCFNTIAKHNKE